MSSSAVEQSLISLITRATAKVKLASGYYFSADQSSHEADCIIKPCVSL